MCWNTSSHVHTRRNLMKRIQHGNLWRCARSDILSLLTCGQINVNSSVNKHCLIAEKTQAPCCFSSGLPKWDIWHLSPLFTSWTQRSEHSLSHSSWNITNWIFTPASLYGFSVGLSNDILFVYSWHFGCILFKVVLNKRSLVGLDFGTHCAIKTKQNCKFWVLCLIFWEIDKMALTNLKKKKKNAGRTAEYESESCWK